MTQAEMKEFVDTSAARVGEEVRKVRKEDSLVFLTFSDLHIKTAEDARVENLLLALEALDAAVSPDYAVNLGDNPDMLGRMDHIPNPELAALFSKLFDRMQGAVRCPLLLIHGNHDGPGTDFFMPDFWNAITKGRYGHDKAVYGEEGSWCYLDVPAPEVRLVMLSMPYGSDVEREIPTPLWRFGDAQLKWLANTALDTQLPVVLLVHVPLFYEYTGDRESMLGVWTGERAAESFIKDLCGEIGDRETAMGILLAFHNHEAYVREELGIALKPSAESARLAGCFSGHNHIDSMWAPGDARGVRINRLPCTQVVTKAFGMNYGEQKETGVEVAVDAVVWTPSEGVCHMFRLGDGEDRVFAE